MILCVGQSAYDITIPIDNYPEENKKYKVQEVTECGGGSANNAAYLLAKWHDEVALASPVGNDDYGKRVIKELTDIGVNTNYFEVIDNVNTTTSYIINNRSNGSRTIITHRNKDLHFSMNHEINVKPDVILFDGNEYEMSMKVIDKNPNSVKIIDAGNNNKVGIIDLCKRCDYIVCSNDFAKEYSKIDFDYSDINKICEVYDLIQKDFTGKLVITLEHMGSLTKIDNEFKLVKSVKVESVDSTGAGDIYHGAFAHFLAHGYNLLDTMKYSNIAGALSVTKLGSKNSMPNYEDVINYHEL